jgi:hypothetical protein
MKNKTYKTEHPDIPYITIGDQFVLNNGDVIQFDSFIHGNYQYPFKMFMLGNRYTINLITFDRRLRYDLDGTVSTYDIKSKCITLKDKLGAL